MKNNDFKLGGISCSQHTIKQEVEEIKLLLENKSLQPRLILTMNAHIYNIAYSDYGLRKILNSARIVTADGMSIVYVSRLFGTKIKERCNATEAFRTFLKDNNMPKNKGLLVGCTDDEVQLAAKNIEAMSSHCKIIKTISGYFDELTYEKKFLSYRDIDFIFLGMGTPKTEKISYIASRTCPNAIVWGIGGGTIKIMAGTMKEAPIVMRRIGFQWLHRLFSDPLNLWHRYLIGNPLFLWRITYFYLRSKINSRFNKV